MEYFSNPPAPCPNEKLPKPKEVQATDSSKRKAIDDEIGMGSTFDDEEHYGSIIWI